MRYSRRKALSLLTAATTLAFTSLANAQDQDLTPEEVAMLRFGNCNYLAFIKSDSEALNVNARTGLANVANEINKRTSLTLEEEVASLDIEGDFLMPFQFIYWPISATANTISEDAQRKVQTFLDRGGLIMFDVQDRGATANTTNAVQKVIGDVNLGPLEEFPENHTLSRTFFKVSDLNGSTNFDPVFVQEADPSQSEDVSSVIISRRDWARAWGGVSLNTQSDAYQTAIYGAINAVLYAYTGDYKGHQYRIKKTLDNIRE